VCVRILFRDHSVRRESPFPWTGPPVFALDTAYQLNWTPTPMGGGGGGLGFLVSALRRNASTSHHVPRGQRQSLLALPALFVILKKLLLRFALVHHRVRRKIDSLPARRFTDSAACSGVVDCHSRTRSCFFMCG